MPLDARLAAAFALDGRVAVVTGSAGGLGLATARMLARAGARVVLADLDALAVARRVDELGAEGLAASGGPLDVTDREAVDRFADGVVERLGRLDVWVNNAAVISDVTPSTVDEADLDRVLAVNFKGVVFGSQAAARHMRAAGRGSIVNLTSGAVDIPMGWVASYSTSKAAAHQFTRSLAVELAPAGVRVNAVAPGWVLTPMNERHIRQADGVVRAEDRERLTAERVRGIPLGRAGQPDDIAYAVLFLAGEASAFMTGSTLRPNGGMTMPW